MKEKALRMISERLFPLKSRRNRNQYRQSVFRVTGIGGKEGRLLSFRDKSEGSAKAEQAPEGA